MASYHHYEVPSRDRSSRQYYREETRYADPRDPYLSLHTSRELVLPRQGSDLSIEEIRRDFPPPGYRDSHRARSAEPGYDDYYDGRRSRSGHGDRDYEHGRDHGRHGGGSRKPRSIYYEEEERKKARMLSKQEQIMAAVTGAALAIGGKEVFDRRDAESRGGEVQRNVLASAALGAAGALAGYQGTELYNKHKEKDEKKTTHVVHKGRDSRTSDHYYSHSDEDEDGREKNGNKSFLESALAAAGLGGAVKALTGGGSSRDDRSDTRSRPSRSWSRSRSRSRSPSRGRGEGSNKMQKAAMASLIAGASEAFRISKEPGGWKGEKAKRVLTAAVGAAAIDSTQGSEKAGSKRGIAEAVIGGLVGNRMLNGSKKNIEEDKKGRSRSRSRARASGGNGGLAALASAGLGAVAGKRLMDAGERSRSRARSRDLYDSRDGSPRRRSRSNSVVDRARNSLARLGIGNGADDDVRSRDRSQDGRRDHSLDARRHQDDYHEEPRSSRRYRKYDDEDFRDDRDNSRSRQRGHGRDRSRGGASSDSDLGDSDEDEKKYKKMRGKQALTTGLAAVATIHAAHSVYQSMENQNARHKAVNQGKLSSEEARKLKSKALLQDAASVGIAALGIKGAISEMKEVQEMRHEIKEFAHEKEERHKKRLERAKLLTNGEVIEECSPDSRCSRSRHGADDNGSRTASSRSSPCDDGPRYTDGNPYAYASGALPAPPVGLADRK